MEPSTCHEGCEAQSKLMHAGVNRMDKSPTKPVYILAGTDDYLRKEHLASLIERLTGQRNTNQAYIRWYDSSADLAEVLDEVRTVPLLGPCRIVIVQQADAFIYKHAEALEKYLGQPSTSGVMIFIVDSWPPKSAGKGKTKSSSKTSRVLSRLGKIVAKSGEVITCSTPSRTAISRWIIQKLEAEKKSISPDAVKLLLQWTGGELISLRNAIDKLILYTTDRNEITPTDVSDVIVSASQVEPFDLCRSINNRSVSQSLVLLSKLIVHRGDEFRTMGLIAWQIRRDLQHATEGRQFRRTVRAMRNLLKTDLAMKTGFEPKSAMQLLVVNLCTNR